MTEPDQENKPAQEAQPESAPNIEFGDQPEGAKNKDAVQEAVEQKENPAPELPVDSASTTVANPQNLAAQPNEEKPAAKNKDTGKQKRPSSSKKHRKLRRKGKRATTNYDKMVAHFAACGRCSYFLAGYRVLHGVENLETAVSQSPAEKLNLSWNFDMRDLLTKSYGVTFYIDHLYFEAVCPECGRQYNYTAGDEGKEDTFHVEMSRRRK